MKSNDLERAPLPETLSLLVQEHLRDLAVLQQRAELLGERVARLKQWLAQKAQRCDPGLPGSEAPLPTISVLIVSEHASMQKLLEDLLARLGCRCFSVGGIEQAAINAPPCDVILLDEVWPLDHTLANLRQWRDLNPGVPVVVGAVLSEGPARDQLRAAGVTAFVAKPYDPDDLARSLRSAITSHAS